MEITLELANTMADFEVARERLNELFAAGRLTAETTGDLEVIVEEVLANIISYAYPDEDEGPVYVDVRVDPSTVTLVFRDRGAPYDPLARPDPDIDAPIADRPIGGLGVFLTTALASDVAYERRDGANVLTVTKRL
jgi:anti-sigma regulatory factor (Ser/Thr protein kinase)